MTSARRARQAGPSITSTSRTAGEIGSRLSLDLGLRFEKEVIPSFRRDIKPFAFEFGWGSKIAPRLGGSFDLFGNGKVKIYGSWGRYFDWVKYELARGTFGGDVWRTYYRPLDSIDKNYILGLSGTNLPGNNLWPTAFQDWRIPAFGAEQLDPNIRPMSSYVVNVGHGVPGGSAVDGSSAVHP